MWAQKEFLNLVVTAWGEFQEVLAKCSKAQMMMTGVDGTWSVKDIIAHITWFEREMIGMLQSRRLAGSELWDLPRDERNSKIYEQNLSANLVDVLAESKRIHAELCILIEGCSDEDLNMASMFKQMPPDWIPAEVIAGNTYEHYRDHSASIQIFLNEGLIV